MDANDVLKRFGKESVGIIVAEVGFPREGELGDIPDVLDVGGFDPLLVELLFIERDAGIDPITSLLQAIALQLRKFLS